MSDGLNALFSSQIFIPHGHCYLWKPRLLAMQIISNLLIALACLAIAAALTRLRARAAPPYRSPLLAGALLTVAAGSTFVLNAVVIWNPLYWLDGAARVLTALLAVIAAIAALRAAARVRS